MLCSFQNNSQEHDMDETGVTVHLTMEKQPLKAGVIAVGGGGSIPPNSTSIFMFFFTLCQNCHQMLVYNFSRNTKSPEIKFLCN